MRTQNVIVLAAGLALLTAAGAHADTTITSPPFNLTNTVPGLNGTFYYADSGIHSLSDAESYIKSSTPTGTFVANNINYIKYDSTSIKDFLGTDGASYKGTETSATVGAFTLNGYVYVPTAGSYQFTLGSDDGSRLDIAGQTITTLDGDHDYYTNTENVTFNKSGYYDLKVTYYNINFDNFSGNADLTLSSSLNFVRPVPEASTLTLGLLGFAGLGMFLVRTRFNKAKNLA